ncbi:hypothetical protein I305_03043 [Cryptococcus gattii E566]|uniref:Uncharacterized protein n=2 Tax=Cryptococcus gattii TaxID=37769 RepID=E6QZH8_CRYGW|nr:Hypothetical Protein CGB_A2640W [Cryptococcus gattii WM276]ADV19489.1 Hypothetical Protein CGB_A2640W [Cryptococcus gattii WM276]KIR79895.1 hypothetical protein I306_03058 [Cryptococcus gattii EJB2]KIY34263.1 hypothetical protein I305_03043 [Cryptococcus gattii E566]KJE05377.1 hypothetical protein I311_01056 [Cryptococcus gattii NT-10]
MMSADSSAPFRKALLGLLVVVLICVAVDLFS